MSASKPTGRPGLPVDIRRLASPVLALAGLIVIGVLSLDLMTGALPSLPGGGGGGGGGDGGPIRTPTPSNIVVVDPRTKVLGSILYAKAGNLWMQSGDRAVQVTIGGLDAMPTWSPDGSAIYFIRSTPSSGRWRVNGVQRDYRLEIPALMRMVPRADATPEQLLVGTITRSKLTWSYFLRDPAISPDGKVAAVITDGPDPGASDVVLKFLDLATLTLVDPKVPQTTPLGHQDPAWSPDGQSVLYVKNGRDGMRGAPTIERYDRTTKKVSALAGPGYLEPAFSPDGRYVAATRSDSFGTDIVILDAANGTELLRVTRDEHSFAPVWSPAGDAIAFLRIDRGVVDLFTVRLSGTAPSWTVEKPLQLTFAAGLDAASGPAWFIPADQLPKPTPSPTPEPSAVLSPPSSVAP